VIALLLVWRGHPGRGEIIGTIGIALLLLGLAYPPSLKYPSAVWWRFSRILGHVNAHILLTLMFSIVFVPVSLLWRAMGKDPLERKRSRWRGWAPYPASHRDRMHYTKMF
jgi:hypothetical protein